MVNIQGSGWDHGEARAFVNDLERTLPEKNPYAMGTLEGYLGTRDLSELKDALSHMLDVTDGKVIDWNPSARDTQVLANAQDICNKMGELAGQHIKWSSQLNHNNESSLMETSLAQVIQGKTIAKQNHFAAVVCGHNSTGAESRVMQSQLGLRLKEAVYVGDKGGALNALEKSGKFGTALVLLLTKEVLEDDDAMAVAYHAIKCGSTLVPINLAGQGYDYGSAHASILKIQAEWLPEEEREAVPKALLNVLPNSICVDWRPNGGENQTKAAVEEVARRIDAARSEKLKEHSVHSRVRDVPTQKKSLRFRVEMKNKKCSSTPSTHTESV